MDTARTPLRSQALATMSSTERHCEKTRHLSPPSDIAARVARDGDRSPALWRPLVPACVGIVPPAASTRRMRVISASIFAPYSPAPSNGIDGPVAPGASSSSSSSLFSSTRPPVAVTWNSSCFWNDARHIGQLPRSVGPTTCFRQSAQYTCAHGVSTGVPCGSDLQIGHTNSADSSSSATSTPSSALLAPLDLSSSRRQISSLCLM
mmetsp:Transcript_10360/g.36195  ORF Transcript_10360/g.36195 Transcript_10360/m.36195 type:complete len:206 (+) Transcript_10360:679-1296(+)